MARVDWQAYLRTFHAERAGITEAVLEHVADHVGATPYDWAAEPVRAGTVVDLACGSAPMASRLRHCRYVGMDLSSAELVAAAARGLPVARAQATRLPLADASVDAVVMSMALMLLPVQETLREVRRVLRPGGVFVATVPHHRPMPRTHWLRYARLCLALRHPRLRYPGDADLRDAAGAFAAAGLRLEQDDARPFNCDIPDARVAEQLLASLYLPDVAPARLQAGRRVVLSWVGTRLTTPIRRLVARR